MGMFVVWIIFFLQAEDGIREIGVTGVQTCALPICRNRRVTFSQRTTFAHWLIRIGRSRQDCTHFAYIVPIIVDRKSVVSGKSVDFGGRRFINKKTTRSRAISTVTYESNLDGNDPQD